MRLDSQFGPEKILGPTFKDSFLYVLDEAQTAGNEHEEAFADVNGEVPLPVLYPIIQKLAERTNVKIIVSGTGFPSGLVRTVLATSVCKDGPSWTTVHAIGDFTSKDAQLTYISQYLPPSFFLSPSGIDLKTRIYGWLRGRHRVTARYLEEVLKGNWMENHPASPHKLLNAYIQCFTNFTPCDSEMSLLNQEADVDAETLNIRGFEWDKIRLEPNLLSALSNGVYGYITRGEYPTWKPGHELLVEYGLASYIDNKKTTTIQEPIALVGIVRYFESHNLVVGEDNHALELLPHTTLVSAPHAQEFLNLLSRSLPGKSRGEVDDKAGS